MERPQSLTTFRFSIGRCLPHDRPEARYITRLSMALESLRIVGDLLTRDIEHRQRMYLVRLMASHLYEALSLIEPPRGKRATRRSALLPVDDFLASYGETHQDLQQAVRDAQTEVTLRLSQPLCFRLVPVSLRFELTRIRNQFFHFGWEKRDVPPLTAAMKAAANLDGAYVTGENLMHAQFAEEIAGQMMHPFLSYEIFDEDGTRELDRAILELIGPIAKFAQAAEALHLHSRDHGVVTVEHPDGRLQVL
jgi:hypothetical protein